LEREFQIGDFRLERLQKRREAEQRMPGTCRISSIVALLAAVFLLGAAGCGQQSVAPSAGKETGEEEAGDGGEASGEEGEPVSKEEQQRRTREGNLHADLGQVYLKYGEFEKAAESYQKAIAATKGLSENAIYHLGLAQAFQGLGKDAEQVKNLETALGIFQKILARADEKQRDFYIEKICLLYRELGRMEEARAWAEKIAGSPGDPASVVKLARLYALLGMDSLAVDTYKMAVKKLKDEPGLPPVRLEYADYLYGNKNLEAARAQAERVLAESGNEELRLRAKRLLLRIYDGLGILGEVEFTSPEKKDDQGGDGEEKKKEENQ